jgi:endonuclease/exonuclease/phosphatase family metal-dependent hydrolase
MTMASSTLGGLRLVSYNAYLLPGALVALGDNTSCVRQGERAAGLGWLCRSLAADVCVFQEVWGSQVSALERLLGVEDGLYYVPERFRSVRAPFSDSSAGSSVLDTVKMGLIGTPTGGLWVAVHRDLPVVWERAKQFSTSGTRSGKGMFAFLVDTTSRESLPRHVLFVATHLDPGHSEELVLSQKAQCRDLRDFLGECISEATDVLRALDNTPSGRGDTRPDFAVVVAGDFNASPNSEVFTELSRLLVSPNDLYLEACQAEGKQLEHTYDEENSLMMWLPSERIDFVLNVLRLASDDKEDDDDVDSTETQRSYLAPVTASGGSLLKQPRGDELSDHWGVLLDLGARDPDRPAPADLDPNALIIESILPGPRLFLGVHSSGALCLSDWPVLWKYDAAARSLSVEGSLLALADGEVCERLANLSTGGSGEPLAFDIPGIDCNPRIGPIRVCGSSLALDVDSGVATNGSRVTLWNHKRLFADNQRWRISVAGDFTALDEEI